MLLTRLLASENTTWQCKIVRIFVEPRSALNIDVWYFPKQGVMFFLHCQLFWSKPSCHRNATCSREEHTSEIEI